MARCRRRRPHRHPIAFRRPGGRLMIDAIRSEWIKLSTITVNKVLVVIAVAFPIVVTALVAGLTERRLHLRRRRRPDRWAGLAVGAVAGCRGHDRNVRGVQLQHDPSDVRRPAGAHQATPRQAARPPRDDSRADRRRHRRRLGRGYQPSRRNVLTFVGRGVRRQRTTGRAARAAAARLRRDPRRLRSRQPDPQHAGRRGGAAAVATRRREHPRPPAVRRAQSRVGQVPAVHAGTDARRSPIVATTPAN